jgi:hypothetical protein
MMMQPQARITFGLNFARIGRVYNPKRKSGTDHVFRRPPVKGGASEASGGLG